MGSRLAGSRLADCLVGLLYFALAAGTLHLNRVNGEIETLWPANAVLLAVMLDRRPGAWAGVLCAGYLADVAANAWSYGLAASTFLHAACDLVEVCTAAILMRPALADQGDDLLEKPAIAGRFLLVCGLVAPASGALGGAIVDRLLSGDDFWQSFTDWLLSSGLGLVIFTPVLLAGFRGDYRRFVRGLDRRGRAEAAGLQVLTVLVAVVVFFVAVRPAMVLLFVPVLLVTFRTGPLGTKLAVALVAIIGAAAIVADQGAITLIGSTSREQAFLLQGLLVILLLTCLPVAAAVTAYRTKLAALAQRAEALRIREAELARIAATDGLTGILNRAAFRDAALPVLRDPARAPVGLIAIDLDFFKPVNDRYGHRTGDRALVHLASVLQAGLRDGDLVGRVGGDEFLILLAARNLAEMEAVAARLQEALRRAPLALEDGTTLLLSMSCGVALHAPGMRFEDLAHAADMALYEAKRVRHRDVARPA